MKNSFTLFFVLAFFVSYAQILRNPVDVPIHPDMLSKSINHQDGNLQKTRTCVDTLRYPQMKEQLVNSPTTFHIFELWTSDAEQMSQTFLLSGANLSITGVEFFGRRGPASSASLVVQVSIFNVDANNIPTTSIASQNITLTDTNFSYRQVTFSSAVNVSNNYAVVLRPTSTSGILEFYVNHALVGQIHDENLSRLKSNYMTGSGGNWVSVPVATSNTAQFSGGPHDFEMIVAPRVSYTITTGFSATPNPVCMQSSVAFSNTTTPASVLSHRMYSYYSFKSYFSSVPDSTYAYLPEPAASIIWSANTSYTFPNNGAITSRLYSLGGLWANCIDSSLQIITVNSLPNVVFNLTTPLVCENTAPFMLTGGTPTGGTYSGQGVNAGEFSPTSAGIGTHSITYTYTDGNGCTSSSVQQITVDACTKISSVDQAEAIMLYPNPTSEILNIRFNNSEFGTVLLKILTIDGRIVHERTITDSEYESVNVGELPKGIYFVNISTDKHSMQAKFIVL